MSFISSIFGGGPNAPALAQQTQLSGLNTQGQTALNQSQNDVNQQGNLLTALQGQNALGNQSQVYNQLQGVANGTGPNPAQAQLAQSTAANTQNQAALMGSQRGTSANPGLIARQAAQTGAANQQASIGQAATLQANQSLGAIGQAGAMANQQAGQLVGQTNTQTAAQQAQAGLALNQLNAQNSANISNQSQAASTQNQSNANAGNFAGSIMGGSGSALSSVASMFAQGGAVEDHPVIAHFKNLKMAKGGKVPAMVSPGEIYLPPKAAKDVAKGSKSPLKAGEKIPGKPKVPGNSYANDTVPKTLQSGGVVIPNSVMQSKDPAGNAHKFVAAVLSKETMKKGKR